MPDHVRTSISGFGYQFLALISGLMLTPVLYRHLGEYLFGIWALLNILAAYEGLSDLGITSAMVFAINQPGDTNRKNELILTGVTVNTALTGLVVLIFILLKGWIFQQLFKINPEAGFVIDTVFKLTLITLMINVVGRSLSAVLDAFQRADLRMNIESFGLLFFVVVALILVVWNNQSIEGLVTAGLLTALVRLLLHVLTFRLICKDFKVSSLPTIAAAKNLITYGLKIQGANFGVILSEPLMRNIIAVGCGPAYAGYVQMGGSVAAVPNSFAHSMIAGLFPALANISGQQDKCAARMLSARFFFFVLYIILPVSIFLFIFAPAIIRIWLGESQVSVAFAVRFLVFAFALRAIAMIPWRISLSLGKPQDTSIAMLLQFVIFIWGSLLIMRLSSQLYVGILLSFTAGYALSTVFLFVRMFGNSEISIRDLMVVIKPNRLKFIAIHIILVLIWQTQSVLLKVNLKLLLINSLILLGSYVLLFLTVLPRQHRRQIGSNIINAVAQRSR